MKDLDWEKNKHGEWHVFNSFWWTLVLKQKEGREFWRLTSGNNKIEAWFRRVGDAKEVARLIQFGLDS